MEDDRVLINRHETKHPSEAKKRKQHHCHLNTAPVQKPKRRESVLSASGTKVRLELSKFEYSVFENLHFNYNDAATLTRYIVQAVSSRLFLLYTLCLIS